MVRKSRRKRPPRESEKNVAPDIRVLEQTLNDLTDANRRLERAAAMLVTPPGEGEPAADPADETANQNDGADARPSGN